MSEMLHEKTKVFANEPHAIKAEVLLQKELPDFKGHFPVRAILPGVVQLDLIQRLAEDKVGHRLRLSSISQLKFLHPLMPEELVQIAIHFDQNFEGYLVSFSLKALKKQEWVVVCQWKVRFINR